MLQPLMEISNPSSGRFLFWARFFTAASTDSLMASMGITWRSGTHWYFFKSDMQCTWQRDGQAETSKCSKDFWEMLMRSRRSHPPQQSSCSPEAESSIVDMAAGVNKRQPVAFTLKRALQ